MKKIKSTLFTLTFLGLIIITGCSENAMTPPELSSKNNLTEKVNNNLTDQKLSLFEFSVKLSPGESYTLKCDAANLETFRIISLKNCDPGQLRVTSTTIDSEVGCQWEGYNGFGLDDITIENTGKSSAISFGNIYGVTRKK
ncbi:MAG TPA: hypothetical protein PK536_00225 [Ignavibacteria bacterium]|nr:hypothetical protein [Bacteroidota bacterium]HRI83849.1 hypothetical protein [Ignavibacteria bacterium]HRJ99980.1 hypothetical protein [Ignavibacteria bacterium]